MNLSDVFHSAEVMLQHEAEDIAVALVEYAQLRGHTPPELGTRSFPIPPLPYSTYGGAEDPTWPRYMKDRVIAAQEEAISWLIREGIIIHNRGAIADVRPYLFTRRGSGLKTRSDVAVYREAALLPRQMVHEDIVDKVVPMFLRGDHDVAVVQAFKAVEVAVRRACPALPPDLVGVKLMRKAFDKIDGPLTDLALVDGEREGDQHLFAGAIAHAKNPGSHRDVEMGRTEAVRLIMLASHLLSIVGKRSAASSRG